MPEPELFDTIKVANWKTQNSVNQLAVKKEWAGQHKKLMDLFRANPGQWIRLPKILSLYISQYGRVIHELRQGGEQIENKTAWINREKHSWYMWVE